MEMEGANQQLLQAEQQAVADSQQPPSLLLQQQQPLVLGGLGSRRKRWPETSMREAGASCLELKGVTAEGLQAVLEFVYTGSLALSVDRAEDILNTASHLQISEAVQLCIRFLQLALSLDNCVELLNLSELYCLDEFGSNVRTFLLENFEDLCRCGALQRLTAAQLSDLLGDNRLRVAGEYLVFFAVVQWLEHEPDSRLPAVGDLIDQTPRTRVRNHQRSVVMCHAENLEAFNLATKRHAFLKDCAVPLYNPCICELANFLYACGGRYDGNEASEMASARCFRYDPRFDAWHELVPMNEARKDFALVATGNSCLMAIGGQDENMVMCTVERLCIATGEWRFLPSLQHAVYCHAAAVCDS
uniref:BACK domain-containing protein n=1 Tax=Macrostomum lignano TaxID=282301 RepID=A0A1I8F312_9PLAT